MNKMELLQKFKENFDLRDLTPLPYGIDFIFNLCAVVSSKEKIDKVYVCPETLSVLTGEAFSSEEMAVLEAMWSGVISYQQKRHIDPKYAYKIENALCSMPKNLTRYKMLLESLLNNSGDVYKTASSLYKRLMNAEEQA